MKPRDAAAFDTTRDGCAMAVEYGEIQHDRPGTHTANEPQVRLNQHRWRGVYRRTVYFVRTGETGTMKRIAMLVSAAALAGGLVVVAGGTAQASPGGCSTWTSGNKGRYANGKCTSGTGEYRVHARCDQPWTPDPYLTTPWVRVGQTTTGDCRDLGVDYTAHDLYLEFR